jgi:hypothetical protein
MMQPHPSAGITPEISIAPPIGNVRAKFFPMN